MLYATIMVHSDLCFVFACEVLTRGRGPKKYTQAEVQLLAKGEVRLEGNNLVSDFGLDVNECFDKISLQFGLFYRHASSSVRLCYSLTQQRFKLNANVRMLVC